MAVAFTTKAMTVLGLVSSPPLTLKRVINAARNRAMTANIQETSRRVNGTYPRLRMWSLAFAHSVFRFLTARWVPAVSCRFSFPRTKFVLVMTLANSGSSNGLGLYGLSRSSCSLSISGVIRTWREREGIQCRVSLFVLFAWSGDCGRNASFSETNTYQDCPWRKSVHSSGVCIISPFNTLDSSSSSSSSSGVAQPSPVSLPAHSDTWMLTRTHIGMS